MADPFPLYVPPETRRLFQSESLLRRFAQMAHWNDGASLLELHGSLGALAIAKALSCHLTIVEPDQRLADAIKERARVVGVGDKVAVQQGAVGALKFAERAFDGIFSFGRVIGLPAAVAKQWRPYLAVGGRLGFTAMVKVGRQRQRAGARQLEDAAGQPAADAPRDVDVHRGRRLRARADRDAQRPRARRVLPRARDDAGEDRRHQRGRRAGAARTRSRCTAPARRASPSASSWPAAKSRARSRPRPATAAENAKPRFPEGSGASDFSAVDQAQCSAPVKSTTSIGSGATWKCTSSR